MQMLEFFTTVEQHPDFTGIAIDTNCEQRNPGVVVKYVKTGLMTRIPVAAIEAAEWSILEDVLSGRREPQVLQHMTRVVGYFSRVENWNKSKIGELKDRQKGNYSIAG